ncbi:MAG: hypothetical protein QNK37_33780 [Acidobacteriota bacterium]|nr:hypothetical protein [Acidobacteriota bacterium]
MALVISLLSTLNVWADVLCCCAFPEAKQETPACHAPVQPAAPSCHGAPTEIPSSTAGFNDQCDCADHLTGTIIAALLTQPQSQVNQSIISVVLPASLPGWLFENNLSVIGRDLPPPDLPTACLQPDQAVLCRFLI